MKRGLIDYGGCLHVHSKHSDGTGTIPEIITAAQDGGLDYLIISDHNRWFPEYHGWHGRLLVIPGAELGHKSNNHVLAFPLTSSNKVPRRATCRELLEFVKKEGALSFIAHPFGPAKPWFGIGSRAWEDWGTDRFVGMELWTYMYDWIEKVGYHNLVKSLKSPEKLITGPFPETIEKWDDLTRRRRVVAIGALDAHARIGPVSLSFKLPSYGYLFKTLRTHVLIEGGFTGDSPEDSRRLTGALADGHCYIGYDLAASSAGFRWQGYTEAETVMMGEPVPPLTEKLRLEAKVPEKSEIVLIRNGYEIKRRSGSFLEWETTRKGVYRVEAYLDGTPWIFSNPIYWY